MLVFREWFVDTFGRKNPAVVLPPAGKPQSFLRLYPCRPNRYEFPAA